MVYVKILSRWLHRLYKLKVYYIDTHGQLFFPLIIIALFLLLPIVFFIRQALSWSSKVRITELWVYPVKGCGGKKVRAAMVTSRGFLHDRSFAILNTETGRVVTQRQEPRLALISCGLQGFDSLDMSYDGDDLILDEYMLAQTKDTRLFSVSDENDEDYQVSDSENDNDDDSKNLRVFLNHLNIPVMEARLKIYLRDLDADPLHGIREIRQLEMRSRVRRAEEKARAKALLEDKEGGVGEGTDLDSSNNNLTPKLPKSKYAALSDPLVSPSGRTDRAGFWRIATTPSSSSNRPVSPTPANSTTASPSHHGSPAGPSSPVPFEPTIHRVLVWDEEIECMDCGDIAALWLRAVFPEAQGSYRLVRMKDAHRRVTPLGYLGGEVEGDSKEEVQRKKKASFGLMTMSDARPFLLANKSSLDVLNKKLVRHTAATGATGSSSNNNMIMSRFRPNIVVEGPAAFAEDNWSSVTFPVMQTLTFFAEPCRRCKVPTNDPDIGEFDEDQEPNTTLKTFHQGSHMGLVDPKAQKEVSNGNELDVNKYRRKCIHCTPIFNSFSLGNY